MQYVFIALSIASGLYGVAMAGNLLAFIIRGIAVSFGDVWIKGIAAGIGIALAFWFAALAGFAL